MSKHATSLVATAWFVVPAAMLLALWFGYNLDREPRLILFSIVASGALVVLALGAQVKPIATCAIGGLVIGYLFQGKGFAYVGVSPFYIGEMVLILGLAALLMSRARWRLSLLELGIIAFMLLGAARTIPYVRSDGLMALRDAALWYYCAFALIVSWLVGEQSIRAFVRTYARLLPWLMLWMLVMATVLRFVEESLPHLPGSPEPILSVMKAGDRAVFLSGLGAFVLSGLYFMVPGVRRIPTSLFWGLWLVCALIATVENRGSMLALGVSNLLVAMLYPSREWLKIAFVGLLGLAILFVWNPQVDIGSNRQLSIEQLSANIVSIYSDETENTGGVQGTKNWRTEFWSDIVDDTVGGSNFWAGRGFGANLGIEYGYTYNEAVRSPHNSFFTVLSRMGVPGAVLWLGLQVTFAVRMVQSFRAATALGQSYWARVHVWLLVMWLAALINSQFDVYLEGPQGAIPFWSVFGAGIVVMRLQQQRQSETRTPTLGGRAYAHPARP